MKKLLLSAVALAAMASTAWADPPAQESKAGPVALTDAQMDNVTAGYLYYPHGGYKSNYAYVSQFAYSKNSNNSAAIGLCAYCGVGNSVWQASSANNYSSIYQF